MTPRIKQSPNQSVITPAVRVHQDGGLTDSAGKSLDPAIGLADYPLPGGGLVTKAPGKGMDIFITYADGTVESYRSHRGRVISTTRLNADRRSRPLPRRRVIDYVLGLDPGTQTCTLSFHAGIPIDRELVRTGPDGNLSITNEATGLDETYRFGEPVPPVEITRPGLSQRWYLVMHRAFAEVRCGDFFDRFYFDWTERLWFRECQLTRLPLNVSLNGLYFRPDGRIVVAASPHPFVLDTTKPFQLLLADGSRVTKESDWWCRFVDPAGVIDEFLFYEGAWRYAHVGVQGYHVQGVLASEAQSDADCNGVLTVHRDGTYRLAGCGLVFSHEEAVDVSTPDLTAFKPAGAGEWLTITDGDTTMIAKYEGSMLAGHEQWFVGGQTQRPPLYESLTPYLLVVASVALFFLLRHAVQEGVEEAIGVVLHVIACVSTLWVMLQGIRALGATVMFVRNFLHHKVF